MVDRFNLTGLNVEVEHYQHALDLITDVFELDADEELRDAIEKSAHHLYGLAHARFITTIRGLGKMVSGSISQGLADPRWRSTRIAILENVHG